MNEIEWLKLQKKRLINGDISLVIAELEKQIKTLGKKRNAGKR